MSPTRLPDFVIIGAAKSATTWLVRNLQRHSKVYLPRVEIHYFSQGYDNGPAWYQAHFTRARPNQVVGERSNTYLVSPDAPVRMKSLMPDLKLIVQLRNPAHRAYSDYCMHLRRGTVSPEIDRYLDIARSPRPQFIDDGFYYKHITNFLRFFRDDDLAVLIYDDIESNADALLCRAYRHVGIDVQEGVPEALEERVFDKGTAELDPRMRRILQPFRPVVDPFLHLPWVRKVRSSLGSVPDYPPLTANLWEKLATTYQADVERLSELIGRDLSSWLTPYQA